MRSHMLRLLLLLLLYYSAGVEGEKIRCLAGTSVLGRGYNLIMANPNLASIGERQAIAHTDPGYAEQIIDFSCKNSRKVADQVHLESYMTCRVEAFREIITGMESYQKLLLANVFYEETGENCKRTRLGREYKGNLTVSSSGKKCLPWNLRRLTMKTKLKVSDDVISGMENHCRNPDSSEEGPWCFTGGRLTDWEYCHVPYCSPDISIPSIKESAFMGQTITDPDTEHDLHLETRKSCKLMKATYTPDDNVNMRGGVKRRICELPEQYEKEPYMIFIDDFGTHVVDWVELGIVLIQRKTSSKDAVFKRLMESGLVKPHLINGTEYFAIKFTDIREEDLSGKGILGNSNKRISIGSFGEKDIVVKPVSQGLQSLEEIFEHKAWMNACKRKKNAECCGRAPQLRRNLRRALSDYAKYKKLQKPKTERTIYGVPAEWPPGFYVIPGQNGRRNVCPSGNWYQTTLTLKYEHKKLKLPEMNDRTFLEIMKGQGGFFGGVMKRGLLSYDVKTDVLKQTFCLREEQSRDEYVWPPGSYCLYRYAKHCPAGFEVRTVKWNDNRPAKIHGTPTPDYHTNAKKGGTSIHLCCRNDPTTKQLLLPTQVPFSLVSNSGPCPRIRGMTTSRQTSVPKCPQHCLRLSQDPTQRTRKRTYKQLRMCSYKTSVEETKEKKIDRRDFGYRSTYFIKGSMSDVLRWEN